MRVEILRYPSYCLELRVMGFKNRRSLGTKGHGEGGSLFLLTG